MCSVWSGEGECEGVCSGGGISVERWRGLGRSRWCHQWEKIGGRRAILRVRYAAANRNLNSNTYKLALSCIIDDQ